MNNSNTFNSFKINKKPKFCNIKQDFVKSNKRFIGESSDKKIPLNSTSQIIINDITQNNIFCGNSQHFPTLTTKKNYSYINISNNLKNSQSNKDRNYLQTQKLRNETLNKNKNELVFKSIKNISNKRSIKPAKQKVNTNLFDNRNKIRSKIFANINLIKGK